MGVLADLIAVAKTISAGPYRSGIDRVTANALAKYIASNGDFSTPTNSAAVNSVHTIAVFTDGIDGGNYKLKVTGADGTQVTTGNILFSANAATIQSAIDTAATGGIAGWVNGDVVVTGGPLSVGTATFTYSGVSVKQSRIPLIAIINSNLTVASTPIEGVTGIGAAAVSVAGQPTRKAWAALFGLSLVAGTIPLFRDDPSSVTAGGAVRGHFPAGLSNDVIKTLVREVGIAESNMTIEATVLALLNI